MLTGEFQGAELKAQNRFSCYSNLLGAMETLKLRQSSYNRMQNFDESFYPVMSGRKDWQKLTIKNGQKNCSGHMQSHLTVTSGINRLQWHQFYKLQINPNFQWRIFTFFIRQAFFRHCFFLWTSENMFKKDESLWIWRKIAYFLDYFASRCTGNSGYNDVREGQLEPALWNALKTVRVRERTKNSRTTDNAVSWTHWYKAKRSSQ